MLLLKYIITLSFLLVQITLTVVCNNQNKMRLLYVLPFSNQSWNHKNWVQCIQHRLEYGTSPPVLWAPSPSSLCIIKFSQPLCISLCAVIFISIYNIAVFFTNVYYFSEILRYKELQVNFNEYTSLVLYRLWFTVAYQ